MLLLALSLLALAVGPGLAQLARNRPRLLDGLDGFVVATIAGIVALHVIPHALAELGARAVVPLAIGVVLPSWLERPKRKSGGLAVDMILVVGLALHALVDGIALNTHEGHAHGGHDAHGGEVLAVAVSLHRIPEGLAVWWIVAPKRGPRGGALALAIIAVASCTGYLLSEPLAERVPASLFIGFEVLVAGSLLHVVAHHELTSRPGEAHAHDHRKQHGHVHESGAFASGIGSLVGAGFLFAITREHPITYRVARELGFGTTFGTLALATAPILLLALVLSSALHAIRPRVDRLLAPGRSRLAAAIAGGLGGALLPICSCEIREFYRERIGKGGWPRTDALSLLVSAPEMELASLLLSATLIDPRFAVARPMALGVIGGLVGIVLGKSRSNESAALPAPARTTTRSLREGLVFALGETVEHTGPWLVFGLFLAALAEPFIAPESLRMLPLPFVIVGFALAGACVPLCASGVTPLLVVLAHKGASPGALLAFLVMAAAGNVRVVRLLARIHSAAFAGRFAAVVFLSALAAGFGGAAVWRGGMDPPLHRMDGTGNVLEWCSVAVLAVLGLVAILRRGPRTLLLRLVGT